LRKRRDLDRDGFPTWLCAADCDCDDHDAAVNPAATDVRGDGVDSDCDGQDPEAAPSAAGAPADAPPPSSAAGGADAGRGAAPDGGPPALASAQQAGCPAPDGGAGECGDAAVSGSPAGARPPGPPPNIVIITIDTLRADHMSCYGYERPTTPNLDRLAASGTLFEQARVQGPMTRFSVPSFVTGRYHSELKRTGGKWPRVAPEHRALGDRFKELGYATAAVSCHFYFLRRYGLTQGFDVVDLKPAFTRTPFHRHVTGDLVTKHGLGLLPDLKAKQPFLLWLHYGDPHSDYRNHPSAPQWGRTWKDLYDQEVYFTDSEIERLRLGLEREGLLDRTVLVVSSDHGEGLKRSEDHGKLFHGQHVYDNLVRVPLIITGPQVVARRVPQPAVGLIDVLPTLLELAGAPRDPELRGTSLVPYLRGRTPPRGPVFGERPTDRRPAQVYMVQWPDKLIWDIATNRFQRFRLDEDPNERSNLYGRDADRDRALVGTLKDWYGKDFVRIPVVARLKR